jgi:hypothetical protein
MNPLQIRDTLVEQVELWGTGHPNVPRFYANSGIPDLDKVVRPYVNVMFSWLGTEQIELGSGSGQRERTMGLMEIRVFVKEGDGERAALQLAVSLREHFKRKNFSGVQVRTPSLLDPETQKGWYAQPIVVPFFSDTP